MTHLIRRFPLIALFAGVVLHANRTAPPLAAEFDNKTAAFAIAFKDEIAAYRDISGFVLPGATLTLETVGGATGDYTLEADRGVVTRRTPRKWQWSAPRAQGIYNLRFDGPSHQGTITLHVFVMVPAGEQRDDLLNGYRIGRYPPPKGNPLYEPPAGFVEVTKENQDTKVSPHFRLKQFLCKQDTSSPFPKYVVLKERLLLKLEAILERVNMLGFRADTLHVLSAYRTPYYNHAIGDVLYSMHQWGGAADIYIDEDNKGVMDDLNRDGQVDVQDARYLSDVIEQMFSLGEFQKFQGGMGVYPATSAHPPFVHVDVRGVKARWQG
jgi:hypothetical protein